MTKDTRRAKETSEGKTTRRAKEASEGKGTRRAKESPSPRPGERAKLLFVLTLLSCAHRAPPAPLDTRAEKWREWSDRVEAFPPCLPREWDDTAPLEPNTTLEPGQTIHVRGPLTLIDFDCRDQIRDLLLRGRWLPDASSEMTLSEIEAAVARSDRETCGSVLGLRSGGTDFAIEPPFPVRIWRENDALLFDELISQTNAVVFGVIDTGRPPQVLVRVDRACRMPGPALTLPKLIDDGRRWKLVDGLEQLADHPSLSRIRRAQSLRVLVDVAFVSEPKRAEAAARRLAAEYSDPAPLQRVLRARSLEP